MQTIKFKAKDQFQKDFAAELTKRVRQYFKDNGKTTFGGWAMILKAILMISMYLAPFILLLCLDFNPWIALVFAIIMGIGKAGIGMGVMHDAAHGSFSKYKWLNKLMANSILLLGADLVVWKIQHNVFHHTYPNVFEWDEDIETKGIIRLSKHAEHHKAFKYQYIFGPFLYGLMTLSKFFGDFSQLKTYSKSGVLKLFEKSYNSRVIKLIVSKVIYLAVLIGLPFIFTDYSWWQILVGFFAMHVVASLIMGNVFQMAHVVEETEEPLPDENGVIHNQFYVHQLETTADFGKPNSLLGWYVGGLDFQAIHHLFPHISHIHYPKLSKIVRKTAQEFNQPYYNHKSVFKAFRSHVLALKRLA